MTDFVSQYGMIISGAILLVAYIFIATEKIQKSVVALVGAALTMLLGLIPFTVITTARQVNISVPYLTTSNLK